MEGMMQYPPGDSRMIDKIVHQLKSQGIFDQFRKECLADVDTKPAYQNLHQRVEGSVSGFLSSQEWRPDLNKNQLRDSLRKHIHESGFLDIGVERIVDQVVNPKIMTVFMPQVEDVVYKFLGIEKPKKGKENQNVYVAPLTVENLAKKEQKRLPTLTDLLPKELEPISPESDTLRGKEDNSLEDGEVGLGDEKEEEDSSPPFEPIERVNSRIEESSMDSHLSGISELTSHDSQHSHSVFNTTATVKPTPTKPILDLSNNDSQLSKVSSGSRLSIVSLGDQDFKLQYDAESNEESQQSKSSIQAPCPQVNAEEIKKDIEAMKEEDNNEMIAGLSEESNSSSNKLQIYTQENSENNSLDVKDIKDDECDGQDKKLHENNTSNEFDKMSFEINIEKKLDEIEENPSNDEFTQSCIDYIPAKDDMTEEEAEIEVKIEEKLGILQQEMYSEGLDENVEEKPEIGDTKHEEKLELTSEKGDNENTDKELDQKPAVRSGELLERKVEDKCGSKVDEKKSEKKSDEKFERKNERKIDEKGEKKAEEKHDRKLDEKSERKSDKKYEKQSEEKTDRRSSDKKADEKSIRKSDDKCTRKTDEKKSSDKRLDEKLDRKIDERKSTEKKLDDKGDKKGEDKTDKKLDSKTDKKMDDKKHDKHREERDKTKDRKDEKKKISSESKNSKKIDSSHASESDKKDKHKKDHGENRNRSEKSNKHDSKETKDKSKREERGEKDTTKEKSKYEIKDNKDEKKTEERDKKNEKESGRDKYKKEETEVSKHEKEVKKSRNEDRKERDGKEKQKTDDRGRTKHDDRERMNSEGRERSDKDRSSRHDDKSKDGSKETKDRRDRGKETLSKSDDKKHRDRLKHDDKSNRSSEKGSIKKSEHKSSRSSDHKSRDSGKKNKESKGKTIIDDHRIHRDKHSEDRRSADRDSNGTAQDRPVGNITSHTNGGESQPSQSRREKSGSTSTSSKSESSKSESDSSCKNNQRVESSRNEENYSVSKSSSPPSSLPFKKRPLSIQSDEEHSDNERHDKSEEPSLCKIKKPKIAANIFEVKKIMMLRKSLAKKERKQQKELKKNQGMKEGIKNIKFEKKVSKPVITKRKKLGDVEKSLRKEVHTSLSQKQIPVVDVEKDDAPEFKYFESEIVPNFLNHYDSQFLAYVKKLIESDNLSDISTPSDSGSEVSDANDVIYLSDINFDERVAKELGARFIKTSKGTEVVFDESSDKEILKRRRASIEAVSGSMVDFNIVGDTVVTLNVSSRPDSVLSNWSEKSVDDYTSVGKRKRERSSSVTSTTSNKSLSDRLELSSNFLRLERHPSSSHRSRKRVFSRKKPKRDLPSPKEIEPIVKRELRKARKPSTRYSNKDFASYSDEDASFDGFQTEQVTTNKEKSSCHELKSDLVVVLNDFKSSTAVKCPQRSSHEDEESSDGEVILECVGDGYDIIKDNNNVDKGSSEDERGCGDGSMLNQDLILPTLRDLMVESGFRREDDKSDILPSIASVGNCLSNNSHDNKKEKKVSSDTYNSNEKVNPRRTSLSRSRPVGLSRPRPKVVTEQRNNEVSGNRTATPSDFVMPLSPESDVSASSGEAKKALHDKVGENHCDPSASNSDDKTAHVSNSRLGDSEARRSLRSGGYGTPGGRGQRYNSDDLYKPRPLFSQGSRRVRGRVSPPLNEDVPNCTDKLMLNMTETPLPSAKKRR